MLVSQSIWAQTVLTGTVIDKTFDEPLTGANIYIMNASNRSIGGTIADLNGEYRLSIPNQKDLSIVFSFIGYKTQTVKFTGQTVINVTLEEEGMALETVEVTAKRIERNSLGQAPKDLITASQKVSLGHIESAPVTSVTEALQGAMANVDILTGGDPGAGSSIRIRGTASLNNSNEPLFVVDGVPLPVDITDDFSFASASSEDYGALLNISPADIESIEVLKDAAATAMYGSKGANGVLLINTKRGDKGRLQFSFSSKYEWKKERNSYPLLNANQYISMIQDAIWNSVSDLGTTTSKSLEYLDLLYNTKEIGFDPSWVYFNEYNQDTDWLDEITQEGFSSDNNFSISGGGDKADYRLSLNYLTEEGTTIGTGFERFSTSFNTRYKFSNDLDINLTYSFTRGVRDASYQDDSNELKKASVRGHALTKMPNMSPYTIDQFGNRTSEYFTPFSSFQGKFTDKVYNPVAMVNEARNRTTSTDSRMIFVLHYRFMQGLDYFGTVGFTGNFTNTDRFLPQSVTGVSWIDEAASASAFIGKDVLYLTTENRFVFNKLFAEKHRIIASALWQTADQTSSSYTSKSATNPSPGISNPIAGALALKGGSGRSIYRDMGGNFNLQYQLFEKYLFQAGYRVEASSSMAANSRWGAFPLVGVAWQLGDEKFVQKLKFISNAKLRLNWGQSGKSPSGTSPYVGTFSAINPGYGEMTAIEPAKPDLSNLKYEVITQTNFGFDLGLFDNSVNMALELYSKETKDLLQKDMVIPSSTGMAKVAYYNSGRISNKGWEFNIDYTAIRTKDWGFNMSFNISQNQNEVLEIPENKKDENYSFKNGTYAYRVIQGDPLGSFYGYKYEGVYQNVAETYAKDATGNLIYDINGEPVIMKNGSQKARPGDAKYKDMNGDGVINEYDITYIGNSNPTLTAGMNFTLRYKNLSLIASFHGRSGQKVINQARMNLESMYNKNNQSTAVLRRWRNEGDDTDIPRALYDRGFNYLGSDRFVEDASFLRVKFVTLKFNCPSDWIKKVGINRLELYVTGYDLFTLTKYKGQEPEINLSPVDGTMQMVAIDKSNTPKPFRIAGGINIKF